MLRSALRIVIPILLLTVLGTRSAAAQNSDPIVAIGPIESAAQVAQLAVTGQGMLDLRALESDGGAPVARCLAPCSLTILPGEYAADLTIGSRTVHTSLVIEPTGTSVRLTRLGGKWFRRSLVIAGGITIAAGLAALIVGEMLWGCSCTSHDSTQWIASAAVLGFVGLGSIVVGSVLTRISNTPRIELARPPRTRWVIGAASTRGGLLVGLALRF